MVAQVFSKCLRNSHTLHFSLRTRTDGDPFVDINERAGNRMAAGGTRFAGLGNNCEVGTRTCLAKAKGSVKFEVCAKAGGKWDAADEIARELVQILPEEPKFWIWHAYATRRMPGGGIPQAREILSNAEEGSSHGVKKRVKRRKSQRSAPWAKEKPRAVRKKVGKRTCNPV